MKPTIKSLIEFAQFFSTEARCEAFLKATRWGDKPFCPYCGWQKIYAFKDGRMYKCAGCRKRFSIKVGTIFESSKIPLQKWFMAIYLLTAHKKGISSLQVSRDLNVTQKTAWFMLHRLRSASQTEAFNARLSGIVEVDETYMGGKERFKHRSRRLTGTQAWGRSTKVKTPVIGMVQRHGHLKAMSFPALGGRRLRETILDHVVLGTKVMTDEFRSYQAIAPFYKHRTVNHSEGEYVRGTRHTNTVEGFFSLFKRGVNGIYHFVSAKHLDSYLREYVFRYNTRTHEEMERVKLLLQNCGTRLTYQQLVASAV